MNGKRYSRQRELIYEALRQTEQHPTAEMIYQCLKPANPSLSLGTVYRNLNLLADEGAIRRMAFPVERYDAKTMPHPHFCCDQCGAVYDLHLPYDAELDRQALLASGHDVTGHEVVFHGICTKCKQLH
ncbi:MAG: transcriptional repressor [Evtepia gabavorous]